jgi:hypothetical protein
LSVRLLRTEELALLVALLENKSSVSIADVANLSVLDMRDGGMGSIRFLSVREGKHRFAAEIAKANYIDGDSVFINIVLNTDENGDLFEIDFWKVDFSPPRRYPRP